MGNVPAVNENQVNDRGAPPNYNQWANLILHLY